MRSAPAFVRLWPKFARSPICCSDGHSVCCTTAAGAVAAGAATVVAPGVVVAGGGAASVVAGCVTVRETVVLGSSFVVAGVGAACVAWVSACFDDPHPAPASTTTSAPRAIERRTRARLLVPRRRPGDIGNEPTFLVQNARRPFDKMYETAQNAAK